MTTSQSQSRPAIQRFEDLEVWQCARELAQGVYRATRTQALRRDRVLCDQMRRAAVSVASNIAEGFERGTRKQQIEFCFIAKGSAGELRCQVTIAHDLELLYARAHEWLSEKCEACSKLLAGYIRSLKLTQDRFPGVKYGPAGPSAS